MSTKIKAEIIKKVLNDNNETCIKSTDKPRQRRIQLMDVFAIFGYELF